LRVVDHGQLKLWEKEAVVDEENYTTVAKEIHGSTDFFSRMLNWVCWREKIRSRLKKRTGTGAIRL
jgi:hypothetical protein